MKKEPFDLFNVSKVRPYLLGLATLWVALFHSYSLDFFKSDYLTRFHLVGLMNRLKETGNCGVDIFLFLSGLGLYFSYTGLQETSKRPIPDFYKRRFGRVLPPVLIVSILYYGLVKTRSVTDWLGKVFLFGCLSPAQEEIGYWYFALLLVLYFLYPLADRVIRRWRFSGTAAMIILSVSAALVIRKLSSGYFARVEIMLTRIPVFLAGIFFGSLCMQHVKIPRILPILCIPAAVAGLAVIPSISFPALFLRRYAYALWTVTIVLAHAFLCSLFTYRSILYRAVCLVGEFSLEMYLIYENLYTAEPRIFLQADAVGFTYAMTVFTASLLLSVLLKMSVKTFREEYRKMRSSSSRGSD